MVKFRRLALGPPGTGTRLGPVLVIGDLAHPGQPVLDGPVAADVSGELLGFGLLGDQAHDVVCDLLTDALTVQAATSRRPRNACAAWGKLIPGSVVRGSTPVVRCSVRPCPRATATCSGAKSSPGQSLLDRGQQRPLAASGREHVVRLAIGAQTACGLALGVQHIGSDTTFPVKSKSASNGASSGISLDLSLDLPLRQYHTSVVADRREQATPGSRPAARRRGPSCHPRPWPAARPYRRWGSALPATH